MYEYKCTKNIYWKFYYSSSKYLCKQRQTHFLIVYMKIKLYIFRLVKWDRETETWCWSYLNLNPQWLICQEHICSPLHHGSDIKRDSEGREALSLSTCADLLLAKVGTDSLEPQRSLNTLRWHRPVSVNCAMKRGRYWIRAAAEHQTARQAVESLSLSLCQPQHT